MKPTLFVLAAGMGSRYGGLKQLDGLGPNGETIMDYSIFDALRGGFGKVVFVIRKDFEQDFKDKILSKYEGHIPCELVFQSIDDLPEGFTCPEGRTKPWGTNHAVLMGKDVIKEPFAVINADDFYGRESFAILADYLKGLEGKKNEYCMVGYRVGNTLSESGSVARGVCETNAEKHLTSVVERTQIERRDGKVMFKEGDIWTAIDDNAPVSMNMWGFTPDYFKYSEEGKHYIYGWHISNLKIYDAPKKLGEFWRDCLEYSELSTNCWSCENVCGDGDETDCNTNGRLYLRRPPQSWCYVEAMKDE